MARRKDIQQRFWGKVDKSAGEDACWIWNAQRGPQGYGRFQVGDVSKLAHRMAWLFTAGRESDACVLHRCDNPSCVNPSHLFEGTRGDNNRDRAEKGRSKPPMVFGEMCHSSRLRDAEVREIRDLVKNGATQQSVGARFGVRQDHVSRICSRKSWAHLS